MSYVTNTFLLVSSSVPSKQLLCFVALCTVETKKANKKVQQRTLSGFYSYAYLTAFHANVSIRFFLRCLYTMHARYRNDSNFISFQSQLIFLTIRQTAEVCWREVNRTDHRMFGCCPVLPLDIHEGNPLSPSFLGFRPLITEKWYLMDRDTSFLVFRITTPINNALLYHFRTQLLPHI